MNIFVLHRDPVVAAQMQCDKHVVKMPTESTQLLSNVFHLNNLRGPYKATHIKHPCTLWAAQSSANFQWLSTLALSLCQEYTKRYHRHHKCEKIIQSMMEDFSLLSFPQESLTPFALCMPEEFRSSDPVESYRNFYIYDKSRFAKWKDGNVPEWYIKDLILV